MNKLSAMILVFAGIIGSGVYASQQEPRSPRTSGLEKFESMLDSHDFDAKHVRTMTRLKEKIDRELLGVKRKQETKVREAQLVLQQISEAMGKGSEKEGEKSE